jgi:hypothetical protein
MSVRTGLRATDGPEKATDGARGSGYADHPPDFLPLTWRFKMPARYRHPLIAGLGTGLSVLGAEGVGFFRLFARAEQHLLGCPTGGRASSIPALLARLATHVNSLDPIATACDVVGDIRNRA